jgi:hypothetical protein
MQSAVAEINAVMVPKQLATQISQMWDNHNMNRRPWLSEKQELRDYLFATDTTKTSNSTLPWKNKTTLPKLCQIRDNLHANYMSALFPNDTWLKWEGYDKDAVTKEKRQAIEAFMSNKAREGNYRTEISKLIYDYIDYGNAFYDTIWENNSTTDPETGETIPGYVGPKLVRISPLDIVFNPLAATFDDSYKITRYLKTFGELRLDLDNRPDLGYNATVIEEMSDYRRGLSQYSPEDINKAVGIEIDGFGSYSDYLQSGLVEILEFEGSIHDQHTGEFKKNVIITVVDRCHVLREEPMPSWLGKSTKGHVSWRMRPDNIYGMGPLDNLVGMQYRIDHLENLKADAMDLAVHPPLVIAGNVEEFVYGPGAEIYVGEGGQITELGQNLAGVLQANNEIALLEQKMEEMAGAPKQAMGIRTPGEKTAFEVQTLEMAASRIFQNKITHFEINLVEPSLNRMLELARRNLDGADLLRVIDDDLGVVQFLSVTKQDITSAGKLRPIGARHFAAQATMIQNFMGLVNSPLWQDPTVRSHFSGKQIAKMVEEMLGLERFALYGDNIQLFESAQSMNMQSQIQEDLMVADQTPTEAE